MPNFRYSGPQSSVPIVPGPFSFLAGLGEAGAAALDAKQADEDKKRKQAQDQLNMMITLRGAGLIAPEQFSSPEAMQLYHTLGVMPVTDKPTPGEQVNAIRGEFLKPDRPAAQIPIPSLGLGQNLNIPAQGPSAVSDEQRAVAGLPSRSAMTREKLDVQTAQTQADTSRDALYDSLAFRSIDAALAQAGGNILVAAAQGPQLMEQAWQIAQQDAKMRGYVANEQLTRTYIEAAFQARWREAQRQAMELATRQAGSTVDPRYLNILQDQQRMIEGQIRALPAPTDMQKTLAAAYQAKVAGAKTPEQQQMIMKDPKLEMLRSAFFEVQNYQSSIAALNNELSGIRDNLQVALSQRVPAAGGPGAGRPATQLTPAQRSLAVQIIRQGKGTLEQLKQRVLDGQMSQTDYAAIESELNSGTGAAVKPTHKMGK